VHPAAAPARKPQHPAAEPCTGTLQQHPPNRAQNSDSSTLQQHPCSSALQQHPAAHKAL